MGLDQNLQSLPGHPSASSYRWSH